MITPGWVGFIDGAFRDSFIYQMRRLFVLVSQSLDEADEFKKDTNIAEIIGFYANPKFVAAVKEQERKTRKDLNYQEKVRAAIAGTLIPIK